MTRRSAQGKHEWQRRAAGYAGELRTGVGRDAGATFASWEARGRPPVWFRVKTRVVIWVRRMRERRT